MGWDIPELLRQSGLANKVLFTYLCRNCKDVTCSKFQGPNKICTKCHNKTCNLPSVTDGVTSESLSNIYNIFDLTQGHYNIKLFENIKIINGQIVKENINKILKTEGFLFAQK